MAALIVILLATVGLSVRAGLCGRRWSAADQEDSALLEACTRSFVIVLLSLLGLLALGVMYGNVLGVGNFSR